MVGFHYETITVPTNDEICRAYSSAISTNQNNIPNLSVDDNQQKICKFNQLFFYPRKSKSFS